MLGQILIVVKEHTKPIKYSQCGSWTSARKLTLGASTLVDAKSYKIEKDTTFTYFVSKMLYISASKSV